MASVLRIVNKANDATIYADMNDPTGANNATYLSSLKTTLMGDMNLGSIPTDHVFFSPENAPGGSVARKRHGLVESSWRIRPLATTADLLVAAMGKLGEFLDDPEDKTILWQPDGAAEKRYLDYVAGLIPQLLRGQELGLLFTRKQFHDPDGTPIVVWRQPYLRGPSVTVGPTTVQNDPADASGRFIEVTNNGNAAAPAAVKVQGDTGAKVQKIVIARKSAGPFASTRVTDYTGGTQYGQLNASGNGWTVTLFNDTTSVADSDASGGFAAQTTHVTNYTVMAKRVRVTRTANMDSLRGTFDVYVRVKSKEADTIRLKLRWAHSLADPATFSEAEITHDTTGLSTFAYVDVKLGRISVPKEHTLGGLALEFWSRSALGGDLMGDFFSLVPADEALSTIVVPYGSEETWDGSQLITPVTDPSGGTAGVVSGTKLNLDTSTDNAGTPPSGGTTLPAGRHRWVFDLENPRTDLAQTANKRLRRIGAPGTNIVNDSLTLFAGVRRTEVVEADIGDANSYQAQVDDPTPSNLNVYSISHAFLPYIASGEEAHSDPAPDKRLLHKMDSSDNIVSPLALEGDDLPVWLAPGLNALYIHYEDVPITSGAPGGESKLTRDCPVTIQFSPRYLT